MITLTPTLARRLVITRQRLAGVRAPANADGIMDILRDLSYIQLDPISAVARSHTLVLWSRLGAYDMAHLDTLLWQERKLFEYWAHAASIVLTEDYPIHSWLMRNHATGDSTWDRRVREWIYDNAALRRYLLTTIRQKGPLLSRDLTEAGIEPKAWVSTGWTSGRNVSRMIDFLWIQGKLMVAGRAGLQKIWDLSERCLPAWTPREKLSEREIVHRTAQRSLRALGVATPRQIEQHFMRGRYPNLAKILSELEAEKKIERAQIIADGQTWQGDWYIHTEDLPLIERLSSGDWKPRTTLLSPFDNLICDRARTRRLFDFDYTVEIYVPQRKRKYGYYVLPILCGDRLIGRIDSAMDREKERLNVNAVFAERDAPMTQQVARAIGKAVEDLGAFLGAKEIVYGKRVPKGWKTLRR